MPPATPHHPSPRFRKLVGLGNLNVPSVSDTNQGTKNLQVWLPCQPKVPNVYTGSSLIALSASANPTPISDLGDPFTCQHMTISCQCHDVSY
ncbi:hypothetical protein HZ326_23439 [Fusarium oxysporum f. sp. albedinis]|nr:hypothetical protein HZ326_23439 [Fusarium oxysporum f. sp. albedinis]